MQGTGMHLKGFGGRGVVSRVTELGEDDDAMPKNHTIFIRIAAFLLKKAKPPL